MASSVHIEKATAADFQTIADIYNEHIALGNATMDETSKQADDIAQWEADFHDREGLFVLKRSGRVLGWGIIKRYSDREGYRFACETAVYLTDGELGKGYGSLMKKYLIKVCREWDYKHLVAKIFASNTSSILYNEKLGYTIVGKQEQIGFKNGQWQDVIIMQYLIEPE